MKVIAVVAGFHLAAVLIVGGFAMGHAIATIAGALLFWWVLFRGLDWASD